jgi:hypothetical protein
MKTLFAILIAAACLPSAMGQDKQPASLPLNAVLKESASIKGFVSGVETAIGFGDSCFHEESNGTFVKKTMEGQGEVYAFSVTCAAEGSSQDYQFEVVKMRGLEGAKDWYLLLNAKLNDAILD